MRSIPAVLALIALSATTATTQPTAQFAVGMESRVWIEGKTNVNGFSCAAATVDATVAIDRAFSEDSALVKHVRSVQVKVPVAALKCGLDQMDKSLRKALRADDSTLTYIVASLAADTPDSTDAATLNTVGTLVIAGRENSVRMNVTAVRLPDGGIEARGEIPILMTDFGITPPTAMLGVVRARNRVIVKFAMRLSPATIAAVSARCGALPH